jgi:hypothetical protein
MNTKAELRRPVRLRIQDGDECVHHGTNRKQGEILTAAVHISAVPRTRLQRSDMLQLL